MAKRKRKSGATGQARPKANRKPATTGSYEHRRKTPQPRRSGTKAQALAAGPFAPRLVEEEIGLPDGTVVRQAFAMVPLYPRRGARVLRTRSRRAIEKPQEVLEVYPGVSVTTRSTVPRPINHFEEFTLANDTPGGLQILNVRIHGVDAQGAPWEQDLDLQPQDLVPGDVAFDEPEGIEGEPGDRVLGFHAEVGGTNPGPTDWVVENKTTDQIRAVHLTVQVGCDGQPVWLRHVSLLHFGTVRDDMLV